MIKLANFLLFFKLLTKFLLKDAIEGWNLLKRRDGKEKDVGYASLIGAMLSIAADVIGNLETPFFLDRVSMNGFIGFAIAGFLGSRLAPVANAIVPFISPAILAISFMIPRARTFLTGGIFTYTITLAGNLSNGSLVSAAGLLTLLVSLAITELCIWITSPSVLYASETWAKSLVTGVHWVVMIAVSILFFAQFVFYMIFMENWSTITADVKENWDQFWTAFKTEVWWVLFPPPPAPPSPPVPSSTVRKFAQNIGWVRKIFYRETENIQHEPFADFKTD